MLFGQAVKRRNPGPCTVARTGEERSRCTGERLGLKARKCKMEFQHKPEHRCFHKMKIAELGWMTLIWQNREIQ